MPTALAISLIHNALTFGKNSKYLSSLIPAYTHTYIDFDVIVDEPFRATLLHSPGRKPWVRCLIYLLSP